MGERIRTLFVLFLLAVLARADALLIEGARIHTVSDALGVIGRGSVLVEDGRIAAVGPDDSFAVPAGVRRIDGRGLVLIPGLVDTHSHLGVSSRPSVAANSDGNEGTGPVQPLVRALDSIFPFDPGFRLAHAGGLTTVNIMPGSSNVMGGQTAYVKLRGRTVEEMLIDLEGGPGGMKMANGENPKRTYGGRKQAPMTRMKVMALQREIFQKARQYREKWKRWWESKEGKRPKRDLTLEPVVEILEGKRTVHFHTHRADDIMSAMRLAEEFGFEVVLHHVTEAYRVRDEIVSRKVACSFTLVDSPGGKPEAIHLRYENPALAYGRGDMKIALNTDDPISESRFFLRTAALAVRGGLDEDVALKAITRWPAEMLHLGKRLGSIEKGKDADLVLLSGDPFSTYSRVLKTWIDGHLVFDRENPEHLRYATGGYHVRGRMPTTPYPPAKPPAAVETPAGEPPSDGPDGPVRGDFAVRAGWIHTVSGGSIRNGVMVVRHGRIAAVGKWGEVEDLPPVTRRVNQITPGLIDAHGSAGLSGALNVPADQDLMETTDPNQAALRALDGFHGRAELLRYLLEHGVTVIQAVPGPRTVISGQAGIFRTHPSGAGQVIRFPSAMVFNLGELPKSDRSKAPGTRMGTAAIIRKALSEAREANRIGNDDRDGSDGEEGTSPEVDLNLEALRLVVDGSLPALFVAHREDDIQTALRLIREFRLTGMLSQATEGYLVRDLLKEAGVPVIAAPTMQRASGLERFNTCLENAALMSDLGIPVAIGSGYESYVPKTRVVLFEAGVAAANGLGWQRALRAVTLDAAKVLGIDKEYGSLEPGKKADFVCFDGDPFEYTSHVSAVYVDGEAVHTRGEGR